MNKCGKCGTPIKWIKTAKNGKSMPVNTKPVSGLTPDGHAATVYVSHFATCAYAAHFRKKT